MSADNQAVMQQFLDAVLGGKPELLDPLIHADFELLHASTVPYAGVYQGAEGFLRFLGIFMGTFDDLTLETGETFAAPSGALICEIVLTGTYKCSGKRVRTSMLEKWEFADGKVLRIKPHYFDPNAEI